MNPDPQLVDILKRLSAGVLEPDEWLNWWESHADWAAEQLNRGQWLRLKPARPGAHGPPSRCTLESQQEAFALLKKWQVEHERSDRYQQAWDADFAKLNAEREEEQKQKRNRFKASLDRLKVAFPKLASYLSRNLESLEELGEPATDEQIAELQRNLGSNLPASYCRFLSCTSSLVYEDSAQIGLLNTFRHPNDPGLPSAGMICFGDFWLEGDGDQVLFGEFEEGKEPAVLYYNHSEPSVRVLADDFTKWIESFPRQLNE